MKNILLIPIFFFTTNLMALSLSEESELSKKSSRIQKIQKKEASRNNLTMKEYEIEQYKLKKERADNIKKKEVKIKEKVLEKKPRVYKPKFKPLSYIKQDTALQRIVSYYYKDKKYIYKYGIEYLMNDKQIGGPDDIAGILNSNDGYLNFYEAIVKVFYQAYYDEKYNSILLDNMNLLYNKSYLSIKDTIIGFLIEDIYLSMGITHIEAPLISNIGYCFTIEDKKMKFACRMNQIQKKCLEGRKKECNKLKVEEQLIGPDAERYLSYKLKSLESRNKELKKELFSK